MAGRTRGHKEVAQPLHAAQQNPSLSPSSRLASTTFVPLELLDLR